MPVTKQNCVRVPKVPRNVGGASSPRNIGTKTDENPLANPIINLAIVINNIFVANVWRIPPPRKVYVFIVSAPLLPRVSTSEPAMIAPNGPPTANAETATDHWNVLCP
mmetsp:Transcript_15415/g.30713  ORF Transcript_15415/g.30713 Transcript_15415/m.30713 type:complete len:108 (-) Transcript_15415:711-1034(-)